VYCAVRTQSLHIIEVDFSLYTCHEQVCGRAASAHTGACERDRDKKYSQSE
jgi:hypothetical protein